MTDDVKLTDAQENELVEKILVLEGLVRSEYVYGVMSEFVDMVFDEQRTKAGQSSQLIEAITEQIDLVRERVAATPVEERTLVDAGELTALWIVKGLVMKAFGFSTYSGPQRRSYIKKGIRKEIEELSAKIGPVRHILDDLFSTTEEEV